VSPGYAVTVELSRRKYAVAVPYRMNESEGKTSENRRNEGV